MNARSGAVGPALAGAHRRIGVAAGALTHARGEVAPRSTSDASHRRRAKSPAAAAWHAHTHTDACVLRPQPHVVDTITLHTS